MNILKKITKPLLIIFISSIVFSCNKNGDSTNLNSIAEDDISSLLSFKEINEDELTSSKWCGHIVSWDEWGRKRRNCGGWGLCNASWFEPCEAQQKNGNFNKFKKSPKGFDTKVYTEEITGRNFIILALKKALPNNININELSLKIDEDIVLDTEKSLGKDLIFNSGIYELDKTIDEFGGYKIYLN